MCVLPPEWNTLHSLVLHNFTHIIFFWVRFLVTVCLYFYLRLLWKRCWPFSPKSWLPLQTLYLILSLLFFNISWLMISALKLIELPVQSANITTIKSSKSTMKCYWLQRSTKLWPKQRIGKVNCIPLIFFCLNFLSCSFPCISLFSRISCISDLNLIATTQLASLVFYVITF